MRLFDDSLLHRPRHDQIIFIPDLVQNIPSQDTLFIVPFLYCFFDFLKFKVFILCCLDLPDESVVPFLNEADRNRVATQCVNMSHRLSWSVFDDILKLQFSIPNEQFLNTYRSWTLFGRMLDNPSRP